MIQKKPKVVLLSLLAFFLVLIISVIYASTCVLALKFLLTCIGVWPKAKGHRSTYITFLPLFDKL